VIVYVESNFLLELAFLQEGHESCQAILDLAKAGQIRLVLPSFCLGEPYEAFHRRDKRRREVSEKLSSEIREMSRSQPYKSFNDETKDFVGSIVKSIEDERNRLNDLFEHELDNFELIQMDADLIKLSVGYQRSIGSPQDAIVFASVTEHLKRLQIDEPKCFITKNSKDFKDPDIEDQLVNFNCKLLFTFEAGLGYMKSKISK
jgi:predicted nucleic acid-binding protein